MGKIEIDTERIKKPLVIVLVLAIAFFVGYKIFVSKQWQFNPDRERALILVEERNRVLQDSILKLHKVADSVGKVNDRKYQAWRSRTNEELQKLKKTFNDERIKNNNMSVNERVDILSKWLNTGN